MKLKKRFFSLLEILIAMTIAMVILVTGLYFYRYAAYMDRELKKEEALSLHSRLIAARLSQSFSHLKASPFFTLPEQQGVSVGPSLIFSFAEDCRDPRFHGQVIARLFVDPEKRLLLAIWPKNSLDDPPMHLDILADKIEGLTFEFLVGEQTNTTYPELKAGDFLQEWSREYPVIPLGIKIKIKGESPQEYAFPLVHCRGMA